MLLLLGRGGGLLGMMRMKIVLEHVILLRIIRFCCENLFPELLELADHLGELLLVFQQVLLVTHANQWGNVRHAKKNKENGIKGLLTIVN